MSAKFNLEFFVVFAGIVVIASCRRRVRA